MDTKVSGNSSKIEWAKTIISALATILVPIIVAYLTIVYQSSREADRNTEIRVKYIDFAISILQEPPENTTLNMRVWAANVLNDLSPVKMHSAHQDFVFAKFPIPKEENSHSKANAADAKSRAAD